MFLFVQFGFSSYEIENFIDFLDQDGNGFVTISQLEGFLQSC